ncbi:ATP-binding protein [Gymnodinialimonas ceratoperidinii]|uniref:Sensory/regulatory protein RpfC n=1 Tax=Gymnodinialimonas ceratoperidinii TaxID=2856823 RepID=A0A8F6TW66_9RHOB|nr:ATP-binding protein [Gymnodinialimonas ceratoperidinii]QXT40062.1 response regulator [Gymnodinialimonas ceratoperidinii]
MAARHINDRMAQERRARLQAEQLLALRSEELYDANRKLAEHATALSTQVIEQREENALLRGLSDKTEAQLEVATERAVTAQRRLWDALTATEDGFAIFDRDWRLVAANPAFFSIFDGVADVTEGATYEAILRIGVEEGIVDLQGEDPEDWVDRMIARWEQDPIPNVDIKLWNGAYIRLNDKQTPQGDFVSLAVDITPNIKRERELAEARDAALAASRAKSSFLANMSHEIRTPMNGVVSMAELLRETPLSEEQQVFADTIRNSGEALLVIINDILDFSKIEAGKLQLHEDSFDLNAMIREIFRLLRPGIRDKELELRLDYDIFMPPRILGDRGRIRQIMTNLIGNAVKFTQEGHVTVRVMAVPRTNDGRGQDMTIVVEDTGVGIALDKQAHIFGEFNQVEDESNRRHDGTGLGLAITKRLLAMMSGEIWLHSDLGRGSAFGFKIPLKVDAGEAAAPVAGLPADRSRVLIIGQGGEREEALFDALGRLHAEATQIRRLPTARDLEGTGAVILCDPSREPAEVAAILDVETFTGARLCSLPPDAATDGFEDCTPGDNLAALRALLIGPAHDEADDSKVVVAPDLSLVADAEASDSRPDQQVRPRPRLLAAEDNKTNQLVFKAMLKGLALDLEIVNDGAELVAAYKRETPDLVMTDISMPVMDGIDASREIRAFEAEQGLEPVTIIAMTAHAVDGDRERILSAGLDDYVTKPLKKTLIHARIEAALSEAGTHLTASDSPLERDTALDMARASDQSCSPDRASAIR